jgi:hypothetical protein
LAGAQLIWLLAIGGLRWNKQERKKNPPDNRFLLPIVFIVFAYKFQLNPE